MLAEEQYREKSRRLIKRDIAVGAAEVIVTAGSLATQAHANALLELPEQITGNVPLQKPDGTFFFIVGSSSPFGSDVF